MALKKARRREAEDGLNITSMMDMMTIILVFLLGFFIILIFKNIHFL